MNPSELNALHIIHVFSAVALVATTFYATAGAPETRRKILIYAGVASLLVLLTGIRLWQGVYAFAGGWAVVKLFCWLGLSALGGVAYRKREKAGLWIKLAVVLSLLAIVLVYTRPF